MDRLLPDGSVPRYRDNQTRSMFTVAEDRKLLKLVNDSGKRPNWRAISIIMKTRTPRQCRERYQNYLNPSLEHVNWTKEEDQLILEKFEDVGPKWNMIAKFLHGRTGNSTRNRYQSLQRKKRKQEKMSKAPSGIDDCHNDKAEITEENLIEQDDLIKTQKYISPKPVVVKHNTNVPNKLSISNLIEPNPETKLTFTDGSSVEKAHIKKIYV